MTPLMIYVQCQSKGVEVGVVADFHVGDQSLLPVTHLQFMCI